MAERIHDLFVIGAGMAGAAGAAFASGRGLDTAMTGTSGAMAYSSGCLDFLSVHPVAESRAWDDPMQALKALSADLPGHPLTRAGAEAAGRSFEEFLNFSAESGLAYSGLHEANKSILSPLGTVKRTACVPATMRGNADALAAKAPCLIVGFKGLKGFSPRQIAEVQGEKWPGLRVEVIDFPGFEDSPDHYCEQLSQTLETPETRDRLVEALRPLVEHAEYVGLPAVLGLYRTREIHRRLEEGLGVRVFEIPTMPPGIPGLRMWERFSEELRGRGVRIHTDANVLAVRRNDSDFELDLGLYGRASETVRARNVLLAGGRCLGGGLRAKRDRLVEPLFGLPVRQPGGREKWHGQDFLDAGGHPVNRAGLDVDDDFRPLDESGRPTQGLYAAGAILAGQDWVREKCGSGLALATALRAVEALTRSG